MSKHTPGPWIFDGIDEVGHFDVYNSSKSTLICTGAGFYGDTPPSESEFNARLIASAPELLEALDALLEQADLGEVDEETKPIVEQARAAIAKARGEA